MPDKFQSFWETVTKSPQWKAWELEVYRRFREFSRDGEFLEQVYDVDECRECGWISDEHFQEFMKFTISAAK